MYDHYFRDWEVRPEFQKEFISLFRGWLGVENLNQLDQVAEVEWQRFNTLLTLIADRYTVLLARPELGSCQAIANASQLTQTYSHSLEKDASSFIRLVIPELDCVLSEDWDFTYILWHKDGSAVRALAPLIEQARLHHFGPSAT